MHEIKCPRCGEVFQVDETGYAQIAQQVRDQEFADELARREQELTRQKDAELHLQRMTQEKALGAALAQKDAAFAEQAKQLERLKAELAQGKLTTQLAVTQAEQRKDQAHDAALAQKDAALAEQAKQLEQLRAELAQGKLTTQLAVAQAEQRKDQELSNRANELTELRARLTSAESERQLQERTLREQYETQLRMKEEQIAYYKDFKARQSTKMVGESLEQHCLTQFNAIRMTAFPTAYFEKDNDARTGSKGDFIFRESADGIEFISIMFEMKNEMDETAAKHRNEDFFRELDKDRREKGCEYAVLVSLLEKDSELYNAGIVDVSYRYEKMYVIRPQFFIPMITLLRNAALNSLRYRQELQIVQNQQLDVRSFEENMNTFKAAFSKNYELASRRFGEAIEEIDKSIAHLQKIKDALTSSERNLRLANDKASDLSIKRLTKNAPAVREMFDALHDGDETT